jgi:hypothetical protein
MFPTFRALVDATANGEIDVAVTNLSITSRQSAAIAFTQPWFGVFTRSISEEFARASGSSCAGTLISKKRRTPLSKAISTPLSARTGARILFLRVSANSGRRRRRAFRSRQIWLGLSRHSPLTEQLTIELLGARERGLVEELRQKYFGDSRDRRREQPSPHNRRRATFSPTSELKHGLKAGHHRCNDPRCQADKQIKVVDPDPLLMASGALEPIAMIVANVVPALPFGHPVNP